MGHRQERKRQRRKERHHPQESSWLLTGPPSSFSDDGDDPDLALLLEMQRSQTTAVRTKSCGGCSEFIEDAEGGRGTCLHPGSGILSPWVDTAGCDFYTRRR